MKKIVCFALIIGLAAMLAAGCSSSSSSTTTKTLNDLSAKSYAEMGSSLASDITGSMGSWASSGSVSGVTGVSVKASGLKIASTVTPSTGGWEHITGEVTVGSASYSVDMYGKVTTDETTGKVTSVSVYGSYTVSMTSGTSTINYTETFGNGAADPYVGTATYSGSTLTGLTCSGSIGFTIATTSATEGNHTIAMTFTLASFSLPVTGGSDYPTGTITLATTYDSVAQPNIVLTFNGTASATMTYGDYTATIVVEAS